MDAYPQRSAVPKGSQQPVTFKPAGHAIECARKQCGRNGMPMLSDRIGPKAEPAKEPPQATEI